MSLRHVCLSLIKFDRITIWNAILKEFKPTLPAVKHSKLSLRNLFVLLIFHVTFFGQTQAQDIQNNLPSGQTLEDFFSSAINFNPRLKVVRGQLDVSSARLDVATGQMLP